MSSEPPPSRRAPRGPYTVGAIIQCLHQHQVSRLVDAADGRLQLHPLPQLTGHALTDLAGATLKLPLLQRQQKPFVFLSFV